MPRLPRSILVLGALLWLCAPIRAREMAALEPQAKPLAGLVEIRRIQTWPEEDLKRWLDPVVSVLGLDLAGAWAGLGPPAQMGVSRGLEPWQDAIIFYYSDHSYLYWWQDRIWQLRVDRFHRDPILGVHMGMGETEVLGILGPPDDRQDRLLRWNLPDRGWPSELLLYFKDGKLDDLYLRRSDF